MSGDEMRSLPGKHAMDAILHCSLHAHQVVALTDECAQFLDVVRCTVCFWEIADCEEFREYRRIDAITFHSTIRDQSHLPRICDVDFHPRPLQLLRDP